MLRCPTCPGVDKPIYGTGPKPARVVLIGEAGGVDEVRQCKPFVGKTGMEFDGQYLPLAGLQREGVYTTNCSKCPGRTKQGGIDNPSNAQARACWAYFSQFELRQVRPDVVVVMGAVAVDAVLGPGIDMEMQHGLPIPGPTQEIQSQTPCMYVPVYHPAAGLHDTKWMIALQDDFRRLRKLARGDYSDVTVDVWPEPLYQEARTALDVDEYFAQFRDETRYGYAGVDTEYTDAGTWCVTVSIMPGTGLFTPANRPDLIARLAHWLKRYTFVFHAALADLTPSLTSVGIYAHRWVDTMQQAYWANEFRIGLKPLAYRYLGMRMSDYGDVVNPPSKLALYDYMTRVRAALLDAVPASRKPKSMDDTDKLVRKTGALVGRLLGDLDKEARGDGKPVKPWTRVNEWQAGTRHVIETFGGECIPQASIVHVDRAAAVQYACRDADATLRLLPAIRRRARELRRRVA